jgi:hypothetical protein
VIRRLLPLIAALLLAPAANADDMIRAVQEALRTRQFYYGEVNGVPSPETAEALRRFQEKKGFDPTGLPDEATMRALGLLPHAGPDAPAAERIEQSRDFIDRYLHACQSGDLAAELAFYADRVDYLADGPEPKAALRTELAAYRRNWPERTLTLLHCVASPSPAKIDEMIATFRYRFDVRGGGHEREGVEDLNVVIRSFGGTLKIVSIREI